MCMCCLVSVLRSINETPVAERASTSALAAAIEADVSNNSITSKEVAESETSPDKTTADRCERIIHKNSNILFLASRNGVLVFRENIL